MSATRDTLSSGCRLGKRPARLEVARRSPPQSLTRPASPTPAVKHVGEPRAGEDRMAGFKLARRDEARSLRRKEPISWAMDESLLVL